MTVARRPSTWGRERERERERGRRSHDPITKLTSENGFEVLIGYYDTVWEKAGPPYVSVIVTRIFVTEHLF